MKIGKLKLTLGAGIIFALIIVWLSTHSDATGVTELTVTAILVISMVALAIVQHREIRKLSRKIDNLRRTAYSLAVGTNEAVGANEAAAGIIGMPDLPAAEIPQEHLEQMTRLVTAHYSRVEQALDDFARQLGVSTISSESGAGTDRTAPATSPPSTPPAAEQDRYYELPIHRHLSPRHIDVGSVARAIHEVRAPGGRSLSVYVDGQIGADLVVTFHGPLGSRDRYPTFERIGAIAELGLACVSFADPATLGGKRGVGWYQGDAEGDLAPTIVEVINRVREQLNPPRVIIYGGSSGGHAALRVSTMIPDSVALVVSPHTDIARCDAKHVQPLIDAAFGGIALQHAREAFRTRMSVTDLYREGSADNLVYYVQNSNEPHTMTKHFPPFADAFGVGADGGVSPDGSKVFSVEAFDSSRELTTKEFRDFLESARSLLDDNRPLGSSSSAI